jgi:hypothetical protein
MKLPLLKTTLAILIFASCSSSKTIKQDDVTVVSNSSDTLLVNPTGNPRSLMELPQTQDGGFVLKEGFYEAEFKTYCLQPGTPDPRRGDAYLHAPITGYRKEIVQAVLLNSRTKPHLSQRNTQLLLWSAVSGSDFNKLSPEVQRDARELLTPQQIFELQGGVVGLIKTVSQTTGLLTANSDIKNLFEKSIQSYEAYERIAVRNEPSRIIKKGVRYDQWYKQKENYYVRYFPENYQKTRIQVYVPDGVLDSANKLNDEYVVFDPTGQQAIPAYTNAQRLGVGAPLIDVVREIIIIQKMNTTPQPRKPKEVETAPKS